MIEKKLQEFDKKLEALNKASFSRPLDEHSGEPSFDEKILKELPLPSFKLPQLETYDGITDPIDHIEIFKIALLFQGASDATLYRAFPATFKGATQQ